MAGCPTVTLPISDSLSGTTSSIVDRSLRTAKADELFEVEAELEDVFELEEPTPVSAERTVEEPPVDDDPLPLVEELLLPLLVPPPETVSPTSPLSETIVPLLGAYSRVSATVSSALCTASLSLFTAAFAEARLASRVAALCLAFSTVPVWW